MAWVIAFEPISVCANVTESGAASRHLVALPIPWLRRVARLGDPLLRGRDEIGGLDQLVHEALVERLVRAELLALHDEPERPLHTDQPRQAAGCRRRPASSRVPPPADPPGHDVG